MELVLRLPKFARALGLTWLDLCNRHEQIELDARTDGRICHWHDSSRLTAARFFPEVGGRLLKHCLREWPVRFAEPVAELPTDKPVVSILVGVRGTARLPQFKTCLAALRAQTGVACEIIVVEQSWKQEFAHVIRPDVRYFHQQASAPGMPYNRSWALNFGARQARGRILVLHDADMVVPERFASEIVERIDRGLDALRLPRFIFYLDEPTSREVQSDHQFPQLPQVDNIVANNPTPIAVDRDVYLALGGHDESFYGWGAEDNEFLDRLRTTRLGEGAFAPVFHLWHPVAANRVGDRNAAQLANIRRLTASQRIAELVQRPFGQSVPSADWETSSGLPPVGAS